MAALLKREEKEETMPLKALVGFQWIADVRTKPQSPVDISVFRLLMQGLKALGSPTSFISLK